MPTLLSEGLALLRHPGSVHLPVQALRCTLAREADGTLVRWHHVNPETGMYRDRQVLDVKL